MIDWSKLKNEVLIFVAVLITGGILISTVLFINLQSNSEMKKASNSLMQAKSRYRQANNRKSLLAEYKNQFLELKYKGIYGEEHRLDWVEAIQKISTDRYIPSVKFELNKQQKIDENNLPEDIRGIDLYMSSMVLDLELLHEGDLFTLLKDLDSKAKGINVVNKCSIKNNYTDLDSVLESKSKSNFSGLCELLWFSVNEAKQYEEDEDEDDS